MLIHYRTIQLSVFINPAQAILQFLAKPESFQKKLLEDWGLKNLPKTTSSLVLNPSFQQKQHKRGPPFVS